MLERWLELCRRITPLGASINPAIAHEIFHDLKARYTAPDRHYHNFEHIEACLRGLDSVRTLARDSDAVELAIWFHDAVYDSKRADNEEQSALLATASCARLSARDPLRESVAALILATNHRDPPASPDAALLVDIDLSILGENVETFDRYERAIRAEYAWVSDADFRAGRSKVLRHFLERPRIFTSDYFFSRCESAARRNLARSLAAL